MAAEIIDILSKHPMAETTLLEAFAPAEGESPRDFQQILHQHLLQLEHMGLIERRYERAATGPDRNA